MFDYEGYLTQCNELNNTAVEWLANSFHSFGFTNISEEEAEEKKQGVKHLHDILNNMDTEYPFKETDVREELEYDPMKDDSPENIIEEGFFDLHRMM